MKKLVSIVLALALVLLCVGAAFAAELAEATSGDPKTITISSPSSAQATDVFVYTVYKVFDATSDGSTQAISYKLLSGVSDAPEGFIVDDSGNVYLGTTNATATNATGEITIKINGETVYFVPQTSELTKDQIDAIRNYTSKDDVGTITITGSATKTVKVPDFGYYFIETTSGTAVTINSTNPSATVIDKNKVPSLDKDIASVTPVNGNGSHTAGEDNEATNPVQTATASIGDTVNYTVKITAHKGAAGYVYHDILSAGLTLVTSSEPVVKVGDKTLEKGTEKDYILTKFANNTPNGTEDNITITFTEKYLNTINADTEISITYSAIVNENAVIAGDGNKNTATLDYGRDGKTNTTPKDEPKVYVYKFQLVKDDANKTILTGAEFELYVDNTFSKKIEVIKISDGQYKVKDSTSESTAASVIEAGTPVIAGLGNGTYYLKETKAPDGYNMIKEPIPVVINNANNEATFANATTYTSGGVEVVNQAGAVLPSTGGIGTTIFYILGGLLVIGAAVILVARRKASN